MGYKLQPKTTIKNNHVFSVAVQVNPKTWDINYNQKPIKHKNT